MNEYDLIVVGGGAAGMFAAIQAGYAGARVLLLEPNERLGKKLYITGKGRCNLTNDCPWQEVLKNVPRNPRFLYSALSGFTPADAITFFESHGCETKTERGSRVFPVTDKSASVVDALKTALGYAGVELRRARAKEILTENGGQIARATDAHVTGVRTDRGDFRAPAVILATGGKSYPATGSTGDGYRMAKALGHTIIPPVGSLVPLVEDGPWCARMQGLALRNVNVRLYEAPSDDACRDKQCLSASSGKEKPVFEEFGELLFTHFGLSGPVILSASSHMEQGKAYIISIDLKPALDEATLDARILRDFAAAKNRSFENALSGLYPKTMIPVMVERSGIPGDTKVNAVTREQRRALLELTKHFTVKISGLRPVEEAIITSGGVSTKEIDPKTMESRLVPGLYFAGEVIDVDAYTGGFNLQIAWSTAYAAAMAAASRK
ncbi:MAG: NAD(P)/FAD-dependent oxidoreductase [Oscillospiraceae bacterium]|nr:NAD(P)/FAD-dependent oxidoreductase [Oscillospiraceae bacterium]MBR4192737.1 NAD(P)/FAD-dependent oxidoreductase [Oscillospiraceae bacterium]